MSTGPTRSDRTDQSSLKSGPPASHPAVVGSGSGVLDLSVSARPFGSDRVRLDRVGPIGSGRSGRIGSDRIGSVRSDRVGPIGSGRSDRIGSGTRCFGFGTRYIGSGTRYFGSGTRYFGSQDIMS